MTNVFISHSSKRDPLAKKVRMCVADGLDAMNYQVKVDTDALRSGRDWCLQLMRWLAECDVAVVLLNERALDSHWVRREVNILMWRRALWPSLRVLPVLVGNVTAEQFRDKGFEDLLTLECVELPHEEGEDIGTYARKLADLTLGEFAGLPDVRHETDHMRRWVEDVSALLEAIDVPGALRDTGRLLGIDDEDLHQLDAHVGAGRLLAHHLLAAASSIVLPGALDELARKQRLSRDDLTQLVSLLAPTWVDGDAARLLLPPGGLHTKRLVALNARDVDTAGQYVERAMCRQFRYYRFHAAGGIPVGEDALEDLVAQCLEAVRQVVGAPKWQDHLKFRPPEDRLHCLILNVRGLRAPLVEQLVARLHELFPWLLIVLLSDESDPVRARLAQRLKGLVVLPDLTEDEEADGYRITLELRELPNRRYGMEVSA